MDGRSCGKEKRKEVERMKILEGGGEGGDWRWWRKYREAVERVEGEKVNGVEGDNGR